MIEVSVLVPVRDDADRLARLLAALEAQTLERSSFEVIVADDGSLEPVEAPTARVTRGAPANSYVARNRAAALARGQVLAFVDADCCPDPGWLEAGLAALRGGGDLAAGFVCFEISPRRSAWELIDAESYIDQRRWVARDRASTANLLVPRPLFERLGGFDETLPSGGDFDFVRRATDGGAALVFARGAVVRHPARATSQAVLGKRWFTTYHGVLRAVRDSERLGSPSVQHALPIVATIARRRADHRPLVTLDVQRLADSGETVRRRDHVRCMARIYLLLEPLSIAARLAGAARGVSIRG